MKPRRPATRNFRRDKLHQFYWLNFRFGPRSRIQPTPGPGAAERRRPRGPPGPPCVQLPCYCRVVGAVTGGGSQLPLPGSNGAFGAWPFVSDMGARVVSGAWASGKVATGGLSAVVLWGAVGAPDFS
jgi:hypothetical protein